MLSLDMMLMAQTGPGVDPGTTPAAWSPYLVGALIGVLSWFTFYFSSHPIGASTAYARAAGFCARWFTPRQLKRWRYFKQNPPKIGWEFMLVLGVIPGALLAAWAGGEITGRWLPPMWVERFGDALWLRIVVAFAGGMCMAWGARLAGGCTSGHGISGALQMSVSSWIALICFFIGGALVAAMLFRW